MDYKKITLRCLNQIIISELCKEMSIDKSNINDTKITKVVQTGKTIYMLCVKNKNIQNDNFTRHPKYMKHDSWKECVDCSDSSSMEDVAWYEEVMYTNIYYNLDEKCSDIAESIINNDFMGTSLVNISNETIRNTIDLFIHIQKTISELNDMIKDYTNKINK